MHLNELTESNEVCCFWPKTVDSNLFVLFNFSFSPSTTAESRSLRMMPATQLLNTHIHTHKHIPICGSEPNISSITILVRMRSACVAKNDENERETIYTLYIIHGFRFNVDWMPVCMDFSFSCIVHINTFGWIFWVRCSRIEHILKLRITKE